MAEEKKEQLYQSVVIQMTEDGPCVVGIPIDKQEPQNN